jgi:uncharacterized protein
VATNTATQPFHNSIVQSNFNRKETKEITHPILFIMASLYDATIGMFTQSLKNLDDILKRAEETAHANKTPLREYVEGRLYPDMNPFPFQIQTACNTAKFLAVRVGGIDNVVQEDNEKTFEELHARIAATLDFLGKVRREDIDGKQDKVVIWREKKFTGISYCTRFAIPNFYFHVMAAYAILRSKGIPIGKGDYMGTVLN